LQAYADGLLVIPKTLAVNAGYDSQEVIVKLLEEGASGQKVSIRLKIVFIFNIFYCRVI
jgi:T-complex protein 1 subunit zeta